jgi:HSP20 family protein
MSLPTRYVRSADPFDAAQRELNAVLNQFFGRGESVLAPYAVDVREDNDSLVVEAELPGFNKEQVDITVENRVLTISAERNDPVEQPAREGYLLKERRFTRFQRGFTLPPTVDDATVGAKLDNGILTVTLAKRQEAKPRKISVA